MNNLMSNGERRRSRILVTITPYDEQEKRVLNASTTSNNIPPAPPAPPVVQPTPPAPPAPPAPPPLPLLAKTKSNEDSVEMQSIESFKLKETPNPVIPKPPPTYFPIQNSTTTVNGSPRHTGTGNKPQVNGKEPSTSPVLETPKSIVPPPPPLAVNAQNLKPAGGKVAIRIGAYEGEAKQPSKLEFLSQQTRVDRNGTSELANGPVVSRLQNELAATLQRSNLRRKTDGEAQPGIKPIPENAATTNNETTNSELPQPGKLPQSNIEKLASALSNKVTIKVNPDHNNR